MYEIKAFLLSINFVCKARKVLFNSELHQQFSYDCGHIRATPEIANSNDE